MSPATEHNQSRSVTVENIREFNIKMIDMARGLAKKCR
jgi:hypothetical protein